MKVCKNCGTTCEDSAAFCTNCGVRVEGVQPENLQMEQMENQQAAPPKKGGNAMPIIALICSILAVLCCCLDGFAFVLAIVAIVLSIISLVKKKGNKGMAIASLVVAIIGFLLSGYLLLVAYVIIPNNPELQYQITEMLEELM